MKKQYKLIYNEGYYILIKIKNNKQIYNCISFLSMYEYIVKTDIDFNKIYLLSMSLYDFLYNWASFDGYISFGGDRI